MLAEVSTSFRGIGLWPSSPPGRLTIGYAVDVSFADRWATGLVDTELDAAVGVMVAHAEERKILALLYKYCPHYKYV